ncbi:MAG: DNA polymerase I [Candidatus Zixiibacteriota bacterium]|nr:MAG: DNA polymerase I [candidate division Zixibacteria bacterium]
MTPAKKNVYLVDGSALFYRAYFAFIRNPLINSKGENTSATFGFVNSLFKIINDEKPDFIAVAFDTPQPTFRHEMYGEYKSTRAKMPDELVEQLPRIRQAVEALNIPSFELEGYEADDIIGTMARVAERQGHKVWCVTGDKDFFQLVSPSIGIYNPRGSSGEPDKYGPEEVKDKFGVYPERVIDKLALMGDTSDNVPGVPGIGPKTADALLEQFGTLDKILTGYDSIKARGTRTKIAENIDSAKLSRELVIIRTDVPLEFEMKDIQAREPNFELAKKLFLELEFNRLLKQLLPDSDAAQVADKEPTTSDARYTQVKDLDQLKSLLEELLKAKEVAVDTETTSLDPLEAKLVGISLCDRARESHYIPLAHTVDSEQNLPLKPALKEIKKLFENKKVQKFGQNIKYDLHVLRNCGIDIEPIGFDTMLAAYVLDPSARDKSLNFLAMKHFDYQMQPISDLIGSGRNQTTFDTVPIDKATFYAAEDADFTYRLRGKFAPLIDQFEMNNLYYNIELPLVRVLADMEREGIRVDTDFLGKLSEKMQGKLDKLIKEIFKIAGTEFNINSTQQLSHILFEKLNLPTKGKTAKKTGYSTDVKVLEELAELHPFPKLILDYRQLTKLTNTYIDAIPKLVRPATGRVHTSFNQTIAATGRLSSTDPNLQNIPVRTEEGREIRKAFIPRDRDHVLLVADYSQIELRILAHYSDDKSLIKAFRGMEDIHARTAAEVYGVDIKKVTPEMRRAAKTANFAVIYGVSAFGLSQQSELTLDESREFIDTYFERYPGIREYMDTMKQTARDTGYVTTLFNRRRYLPEIHSKNFNVRQFAERIAINTPIQGTAADMIKVAMIKIHKKMKGMRSKMVLQVHDELIFDTHKEELDGLKKVVSEGMEKAIKLKVPVVIDLGVGDNWLDAK